MTDLQEILVANLLLSLWRSLECPYGDRCYNFDITYPADHILFANFVVGLNYSLFQFILILPGTCFCWRVRGAFGNIRTHLKLAQNLPKQNETNTDQCISDNDVKFIVILPT